MTQCAVIYTDGGCRPTNPGYAGWGLHGYLFEVEAPKKGAGHPTEVPTAYGYWPKNPAPENRFDLKQLASFESILSEDDRAELNLSEARVADTPPPVKVAHYIDGYGSFPEYGKTNNFAEIVAARRSLEHLKDYDVRHIQLFTDSRYVCDGVNDWRSKWESRNFVRHDGKPVSNADEWRALFKTYDHLVNRGVQIRFEWIKAHADHLGNERADYAATIGVQAARSGRDINDITVTQADGYWKTEVDRHPFLSHRRMYFNTLPGSNIPGEYYLGEHGKVDDFLGKRLVDGSFALVRLKTPNPTLEWLRNHQSALACGSDSLIMARLDFLFSSGMYRALETYGDLAIVKDARDRLDLSGLTLAVKQSDPDEPIGPNDDDEDDDEESGVVEDTPRKNSSRQAQPLTRELRPAKLAMRAIESIIGLDLRLAKYLDRHETITITDLTEVLYERSIKKVKKESVEILTLKPEYNVGFAALTVPANYGFKNTDVQKVDVTLTLGVDAPDRNALKRLETYKPRVSLITWMESVAAFRYAVVIETDEDIGIWCGVYANTRFVKPKP